MNLAAFLLQVFPGIAGIAFLFYARELHHQVDELRRAIDEMSRKLNVEAPAETSTPQLSKPTEPAQPLPQARMIQR